MSGTVTINATIHTIYGTRAAADIYWESMIGPTADAWAANVAKRDKALVMAGRLLDRIQWISIADTFEERDALQVFQYAAYEIAAGLMIDPGLFTSSTSGKNIKAVYSGDGVGVQFFLPTLGITGRFPTQIQELIGAYLAGNARSTYGGSYATGTSSGSSVGGTVAGEQLFGLNWGL